ncbi:MAG TPA: tryptophan 7-halogenase [Acidimicrobiales bacterium]|nr:tryptophan 7-halogenase [Acidimicrobiales bacterium]
MIERWGVAPDTDVVVHEPDEVLVRAGDQLLLYRGVPVGLVRAVVDAASPPAPLGDLLDRLPAGTDRATAEDVVRRLEGVVFRRLPDEEDRGPAAPLVVVVGDGPLAEAVAGAMAAPGALAVAAAALPPAPPTPSEWERAGPAAGHPAGDADALPEGVRLVVVAAEDAPYGAVMAVAADAARKRVPVLFVVPDGGEVVVGPTFVPGASACFECERRAALLGPRAGDGLLAAALPALTLGRAHPARRPAAAALAAEEAHRAVLDPGRATLLAAAVRVGDRPPAPAPLLPDERCTTCAAAAPSPDGPLARQAAVAVALAADRRAGIRVRPRPGPADDAPRTVGVIGGGTAGYLAALALRARVPWLDVTMVESTRFGVIGVGEATTPRLVEFLHSPDGLGLDIVDFHRRVLPVWKLGVHYDWGPPGGDGFAWPFQYGAVHEAVCYGGSLDDHCLAEMLMRARRVPVFATGDGGVTSRLGAVPFAYHLHNARFLTYLRETADAAGVHHVDATVASVECTPAGDEVAALVTDGGGRLAFDLYVDCTGFRSLLLEQAMGSPYHSYASSLFTDAAVVADVPHDGAVKPFTLAETMDSGWCWNIAFEDEDHRGYVFSSAFASVDEAAEEMARKNPGMGDHWSLRFRSGRHEDFWRGNVIGIGNAYAFVEPLASTSIHMTLLELDLLTTNFPASRRDRAVPDGLNRTLGRMWDNLRGWLAVQYRFNTRLDTPFWQECRRTVDLATAADKVALFRERAPLAVASPVAKERLDPFFLSRYAADYFGQDYVYDVMLGGQGVGARWVPPATPRAAWEEAVRRRRAVVDYALPAAAALELARERRPDLLEALVGGPSFIGDELY